MTGIEPYDPLDPDQRIRRGKERTAFFRQTSLFPLVVLTMAVFVPLAIWQKPLALPFLGWMAFMPAIAGGLGVAFGSSSKWIRLSLGSSFRAVVTCALLFFPIVLLFAPAALLLIGGVLLLVYVYCAVSGRLWQRGEIQ